MREEFQNSKVLARGKEVFIGVGVHKESWHFTALVKEEEVFHLRRGQFRNLRRGKNFHEFSGCPLLYEGQLFFLSKMLDIFR